MIILFYFGIKGYFWMESKKMKGLILVLLILIGGGFLTDKFYFQKAAAQKTIMDHIEEKGYADRIGSKKMVYDSKKGLIIWLFPTKMKKVFVTNIFAMAV